DLLDNEQTSLTFVQGCSGLPAGSPLFTAVLNYRHSRLDENVAIGNVNNVKEYSAIELVAARERTNYPFCLAVDDLGHGFALEVQVDKLVCAKRVLNYIQTAMAGLVEV